MTDGQTALRDIDPCWLIEHTLRLLGDHAPSEAVEIEVLRQVSQALAERAEELCDD